jgi:hypothetical protein
MSIQTPYSSNLIQQSIMDALAQTGVSQTTPGGKARAWADAVSSVASSSELRVFNMIAQSFLNTAGGTNLDFLGSIYGVPRIVAQDANANILDANFQFYVTSGTFGSINGGNDIIVPAGTRITTRNLNDPAYTTDYTITCSAADALQYVSVTCSSSGSSGNAANRVYNSHNFTNYSNANFGSLLVTNNYGIVTGRDAEDDQSYAYRIALRLQSTGGAAEADLRFAILQIPGIQDCVFESLAGTYNLYVYGISPTVPLSLLQQVQSVLDENTAYPLVGLAVSPDLVGISLATSVTCVSGLSQAEKQLAASAASTAAAVYINNLGVGNQLVINDISNKMMDSSTSILDIGSSNHPIQQIFIWRSRLDGTRYSRFLVTDYQPAIGERIVIEESISNPINLTVE